MKNPHLQRISATAFIALAPALFAADADSDGLDDSVETNTAITVEYGSTLDGWTQAAHEGTGPEDITITEVPGDPGFSDVTVALPSHLAASGRLFVRLSVLVTMP